MKPGVSIAAVALHHKLNANMLRKWVIEAERERSPKRAVPGAVHAEEVAVPAAAGFVPLALPRHQVEGDIRIELRRGPTSITVTWPTGAAAECAMWLRELLR